MGVNNKHVFDVIVGDSYQASGITNLDIDTLAAGEITIIEPNDRALAVAGADEFQIAQHDIETGFRLSRVINRHRIRNYQYQRYAAPRRKRVSFTFPTAVVGQEYVLHINPLSIKSHRSLRRTYNVIAAVTTAGTNAQALVDAINNDGNNKLVTASLATATITLEAKADDIYFELGLDEGLRGVAVTSLVTPFPGHGTFAQARDIEIKGKGYRGHVNRVKYVDPVNYYTNSTVNTPTLTSPATCGVTINTPTITGDFSASQTNLGRPLAIGDVVRVIGPNAVTTVARVIAITGSTSITISTPYTDATDATLDIDGAAEGIRVETLYDMYTIEHDGSVLGVDEIFRPHITTVVLLKQNGGASADFNTLLDSLVAGA